MNNRIILHLKDKPKYISDFIYRPWEDIPLPESISDKNIIEINRKEIDQINIYAWSKRYSKTRMEIYNLKKPELYCAVHFNLMNSEGQRKDKRIIVKKTQLATFLEEINFGEPLESTNGDIFRNILEV